MFRGIHRRRVCGRSALISLEEDFHRLVAAVIEPLRNIVLYALHERLWRRIDSGPIYLPIFFLQNTQRDFYLPIFFFTETAPR